ncbi:MAG TPA: RraA family protein [Pseudonocardia sp.]|nr:RraA family protein [Pseudonocardia sp.]
MDLVELCARLRRIQVSSMCDADKTLPVCDPAIRPMLADVTVAGPAFTVRADGDLLGMVAALGTAAPGSVLVVDSGGDPRACSGELFAGEAARAGLAGIVIDGFCRDLRGIRRVGLPVFARGATPMAGTISGPAVTGAQVRLGGLDVRPGDIVFGDDDGLVVAAAERLIAALAKAEEIESAESGVAAAMASGTRLFELTNAAEHLAARAQDRPSTFGYRSPTS